jgi:hypothetical protein
VAWAWTAGEIDVQTRNGSRKSFKSSIRTELEGAGDRSWVEKQERKEKKNYAEALSRALAQRFANELRTEFKEILPDERGHGHESRARSSRGIKKLDVNYSTPELGLALGLSIKTINFRDSSTKRYTKNYTRADAELRAEASDYHERQPWAVMAAIVFLPSDACDDGGGNNPSSFGSAVKAFRQRAGRSSPNDSSMLFERIFIGLYDTTPESFGTVGFFDVLNAPPKTGRPKVLMSLSDVMASIVATYNARNSPSFEWADTHEVEVVKEPPVEADDDEED